MNRSLIATAAAALILTACAPVPGIVANNSPGNVAGFWQFETGQSMNLAQKGGKVTGTAMGFPIEGRMTSNRFEATVSYDALEPGAYLVLDAQLSGDRLEGTANGKPATATRRK